MRWPSWVAKMNLMEPSSEVLVSRMSGRPKWNMFLRVTLKPFGRLVMRLKSRSVRPGRPICKSAGRGNA